MADPLFGEQVLRNGLGLGASMELDLRVRQDGGFVVLHEAALEKETTGSGDIIDHTGKELRELCFNEAANGAGASAARPLLLTEDLACSLQSASPDALIQFDMKDGLDAIGERGLKHLTALFGRIPAPIIVSGKSLELIEEIGRCLPGLQRGIDPTDQLVELYRQTGAGAVEAALRTFLDGPTRPGTIYLAWRLLLQASEDGLDLVGLCHDKGASVDAWTFNMANPDAGFSDREWDRFSGLLDLGVDQITTDEAIATEAAYLRRTGG